MTMQKIMGISLNCSFTRVVASIPTAKIRSELVVLNIFYDPLPFIYASLQVINFRYVNVVPLAVFAGVLYLVEI